MGRLEAMDRKDVKEQKDLQDRQEYDINFLNEFSKNNFFRYPGLQIEDQADHKEIPDQMEEMADWVKKSQRFLKLNIVYLGVSGKKGYRGKEGQARGCDQCSGPRTAPGYQTFLLYIHVDNVNMPFFVYSFLI